MKVDLRYEDMKIFYDILITYQKRYEDIMLTVLNMGIGLTSWVVPLRFY